ncbi:MAG: tandem-95 repeat protein [Planctomycetes bacterium]|nr:tandem-95 repeat protein [Planctomycetota bacterium]
MNAPADSRGESGLARLFDELCMRLAAGEPVDLEAYRDQHPEHAAELGELLPTVRLLFDLRDTEGPAPGLAAQPEPRVLGGFRLIREIGHGGMGVVYEAEQLSLGRRVALKILPFASVLRPTQLARFEQEVQIAATLDHSHIVRVFAVGCDRGVHHFAMQLIDGQSLAEAIQQLRDAANAPQPTAPAGPRPADTSRILGANLSTDNSTHDEEYFQAVAQLGIQAAEALQHAHDRGVVHRDIKPSNLMVDAAGHLYVTDFGLARAHGETGLTMSGDVLGTLRYMSPEQASGEPAAVDHRSDIFSLGATLYELLTLHPAFSTEDRYRLLRTGDRETPLPPRHWNEAIPPDLESIVLRAIAHDPHDRYASARALADDLTRFLTRETVQAAECLGSNEWRVAGGGWRVASAASRRVHGVLGTPRFTTGTWRRGVWLAVTLLTVILAVTAGLVLLNQKSLPRASIDAAGLSNRGVELAMQGNLDLAWDDLHRAIQLGPPRAAYYNNRGVLHASRGALEHAAADLDEAIRLEPEWAVAYANRAIVRARLGQIDLALRDVSTLVLLPPLPQAGEGTGGAGEGAGVESTRTLRWTNIDEEPTESLRAFRARAAELIRVLQERTDETDGADTSETTEAGESALATTELTGPASLGRLVCTPGQMTLAIISQTVDLRQTENQAMSIAKTKKRSLQPRPTRPLRHEQLEPRRLLTGTDPGWLLGLGNNETSTARISHTVVDASGDVFISGTISSGTIDFDPGPGVAELSASDVRVTFVAKYASDGTFLWTRGVSGASGNNLALDASGGIFLVGSIFGSATFGETTLVSQGATDMYVAKLDHDGNFLWAVGAGGTDIDSARDVALDTLGHLYVSGHFRNTVSFGGQEFTSNGDFDAFVTKLDGGGQFLWTQVMGSTERDHANSIEVADDGSIYVGGSFGATTSFGDYPLVSAGGEDGYIAKLDPVDGSVLWAQGVGGAIRDGVMDLAYGVDNCIVGHAYTSEPGGANYPTIIFKMDDTGTILWSRSMGGPDGAVGAAGLAVDSDANVYVSGRVDNAADFDPGPESALLVNANPGTDNAEAYVWKLDVDGNFIAAKRMGGSGHDDSTAVAVDMIGNVYVLGHSSSEHLYFPNGTLTSPRIFFAKLPARMFETHIVLFSDSFENGQWGGRWVQDRQKDWFTSTQRATLGSYSAEVDGSASDATLTVASSIDLTPYGSAELTFDWYIESSLDAGEYLAVDLFNGITWTEVARLRGDVDAENVWHQPYVQIPSDHLVSNFQFRFRAKMSGSDEDANVDNVQLVATSLAGPPNQAPLAMDDSAVTDEDVPVAIAVLANDSDPDLDPLTIESVTQGSHGSVAISGQEVIYTPSANYHGGDSFTYTISDGRGGTDTAVVTVDITAVNDAPVAVADSFSTLKDQVLSVAQPGVLINDSDVDGDAFSAVPWSGTSAYGGQVALNADGSFTYTPPAGFTGTDTFGYTITDGSLQSSPATVSIQVTGGVTSALYVYDIRFESKRANKDWRAVFEIRRDSNGDGQGGSTDAVAAGVEITVEFAGVRYTGVTDSSGVFRTSWINNLSSGAHYAEVVDLVLAGYFWDPLALDLEDDSDGDGLPDDILYR